ncbi:MAG: protein phosphatase 2C domain-containing protein [Patescibacteria group bacterium]
MPTVEHISYGKVSEEKNEDFLGYNDTTFVVTDGASDKSGELYDGKTGGYIASRLTVEKCLASSATGEDLARELNNALADLYQKINLRALENSFYRFACSVVCARLQGAELVVTQVGDVAFRVNGEKVYTNYILLDELSSSLRAHYIELTGDVAGSRDFIMPLLKEQHRYPNTTHSPLSYGDIDGTPTPPQFVKSFSFPLQDVKTLEIFTDGYFDLPPEVSLEAWEKVHQQVEAEDPYKTKEYKSTSPKDDRTVMVVRW